MYIYVCDQSFNFRFALDANAYSGLILWSRWNIGKIYSHSSFTILVLANHSIYNLWFVYATNPGDKYRANRMILLALGFVFTSTFANHVNSLVWLFHWVFVSHRKQNKTKQLNRRPVYLITALILQLHPFVCFVFFFLFRIFFFVLRLARVFIANIYLFAKQ